MELQGLALRPDGRADLIYGFAGDSPVEGAFIVSVHGHEVSPVEYVE
jgi:hypothetical protein